MDINIIVDFSYLYHRYYHAINNEHGKPLKRLIIEVCDENENTKDKDISLIYYTIKEIELFRRKYEKKGHKVTITVCMDSKTKRKELDVEGANDYKINRIDKLSSVDFENISEIYEMLTNAGHNVFKLDGYEADDLIHYFAKEKSENYDATIIYSNDSDLLALVGGKVVMCWYKFNKGYIEVQESNYEEVVSREMKVYMPFNTIQLYKCTCGDKADNIKGIKGFGPKAFEKTINKCIEQGIIDLAKCNTESGLMQVVEMMKETYSDEAINDLSQSYELVRNIEVDIDAITDLDVELSRSSCALRAEAYSKYAMVSLID